MVPHLDSTRAEVHQHLGRGREAQAQFSDKNLPTSPCPAILVLSSACADAHCDEQDTEERLRNAEARAGRYGRKLEGAQRRVGLLKQSIQDMFAQAGCNTPATRSMLGDAGVSEANLMIYLGIIEQRTNEILQVKPL